MRDRIDPTAEYAEALSGPVPPYLESVERSTHLMTVAPQMMSGRLQGRWLAMLSKIHRPERILEIGTFTGYGTLCLAEGLAAGGVVHTIEGDEEMASLARQNFAASPFEASIVLHEGQAMEVTESLPQEFDIIYLDGDKDGYPDYLELLVPKLTIGGLLLADNVLWDGKTGKATAGQTAGRLAEYNRRVNADCRLDVVVLPIRDGLSVARRIF